jgi:protein tyrosine phosphatase
VQYSGRANDLYFFFPGNEMQGGSTYVHCKAGRGRSTTIVLCFLVGQMIYLGFRCLVYVH